jgi:site-specific recombinase XerD
LSPRKKSASQRTLASPALADAYLDFILSRQAMNCTPATLEHYTHTALAFLLWAEEQGITTPSEITAKLVRQYIAARREDGNNDRTLHARARGIKTLVRFWHKEGYMPNLVQFEMPRLEKKRMLVLDIDQLRQVIAIGGTRDRAIVLFMADSGLRRGEVCALNWGDVDMMSGLVRVKQGKGKKDRVAVVGAATRRALLKYRSKVDHKDNMPLFQSRTHERLTGDGLQIIFRRLSTKSGIHITPHAMRRTFVILSLRAEMDAGHLQALLGHSSIDMVYYYAQFEDEDLIREHKKHSPIDTLF